MIVRFEHSTMSICQHIAQLRFPSRIIDMGRANRFQTNMTTWPSSSVSAKTVVSLNTSVLFSGMSWYSTHNLCICRPVLATGVFPESEGCCLVWRGDPKACKNWPVSGHPYFQNESQTTRHTTHIHSGRIRRESMSLCAHMNTIFGSSACRGCEVPFPPVGRVKMRKNHSMSYWRAFFCRVFHGTENLSNISDALFYFSSFQPSVCR